MNNYSLYKTLFISIPQHDVVGDIEGRVMKHIARSRVIHTRIKGAIHATIVLVSVIGLIPTIQYFLAQAYDSGFVDYASLFVSDTTYTFTHLKTVILSMSESIPILDSVAVLSIILIGMYSLKRSLQSWSYLHYDSPAYIN